MPRISREKSSTEIYHINQIGNEGCLEIKLLNKLNNKEALETIKQHLSIKSLEELRRLGKKERDASLKELKVIDELSIRQTASIAGFTVNVIAMV